MTAREIYRSVVMLLDEGYEDYYNKSDIEYAINQAQLLLLEKMVANSDEIGLRPFYGKDFVTPPARYLGDTLLYPRGCNLWIENGGEYKFYSSLSYLDYGVYNRWWTPRNITFDGSFTVGYYSLIPKEITGDMYKSLVVNLYGYSAINIYLDFTYIKQPLTYSIGSVEDDDVTVTLLTPYIPELIFNAAEFLNNIDVMDYDRSEIAVQQMGQRITMQGVGNV